MIKKILFFSAALILFYFSAFADDSVTITTYYPSPYGSYNEFTTASNTYLATGSGSVGIGTSSPGAKLEVAGTIKITGGSPGADKVLTSDANGLASWQASSVPPNGLYGHGYTVFQGGYGMSSQGCGEAIEPGYCLSNAFYCRAGYQVVKTGEDDRSTWNWSTVYRWYSCAKQ